MARAALGAVCAVAGLSACQAPEPGVARPAVNSAEALRAVPTSIEVDGGTLTLLVEAWRSYQPTVGRDAGDPLIAILRLTTSSSAGLPGALRSDTAWLAHGDELVAVVPREEQPRQPGGRTVEFVVRDGPSWPTGDSLDAAVVIRGAGAAPLVLRAPGTVIARVH